MLSKKNYTNGQKVFELKDNQLTYYYKETGQLWQVANFKGSMKDGSWIRYDKNDKVEYQENFKEGKIIKNS